MAMEEDGLPKIKLAAKAAEFTVNLLSPMDRVGVAGSTDGIEFVAPMQKLTNKASVISQIRKLDVGGGGIYCKPSMEFAFDKLRAETTKVRHLIFLGDGADCDLQEGCVEIARAMRSQRITTSAIAIGDGPHVPFLKSLAAAGGGRYYLARRAGQLPAIFTQDAAVMSRSAIEDGAFLPKVAMGEEILRGIPSETIPPLFAYCLTDARPLARIGMKTQKDDPLLATWQYGLGSTLAFTSDAQARWAARWVDWGGFNTFWAQALRYVSRRATKNDYQVTTRHDGSRGVVEIEAFDQAGNPMKDLPAEIKVATPDGKARDVVVNQVAPGKFRGTFEASELGSYIVSLAEDDPAGGKRISSSGFSLPYPAEYRNYRANRPLLQRLSQATGGMELKNPIDAMRPAKEPGFSVHELWMLFVLIAALLLPLDVASRRVAIPVVEIWQRFWAWVRSRRAVPVTATQTVITERLAKAKERATTDEVTPRPRIEIPTGPVEEDRPAAATGASQGAAASKLLEAKRKRQQSSDEE
jgi:Ca-activated chloride channel homolog